MNTYKTFLLVFLLGMLIVPAMAVSITDDFNLSATTVSSVSFSYTGSNSLSSYKPLLYFVNTSSISGATEFNNPAILFNGFGTSSCIQTMAAGIQAVDVYVVGAGDAYSNARNSGRITLFPKSNVSSYDAFGNPVYSATYFIGSITLEMDAPMTFLSGDTTQFILLNKTANATGLAPSAATWGTIFPTFTNGAASIGSSTYAPGAAPNVFGGFFSTSDSLPNSLGVEPSKILGYSNTIPTTRYQYEFENVLTLDIDSELYTVDRTIVNKTTASRVNVTDGTGYLSYYPLGSTDITGSFSKFPVNVRIFDGRFNTEFNRTYDIDQFNQLVLSPTSGSLTDTYTERFLNYYGDPINNITNLDSYKLYELTGASTYNQVLNATTGLPIRYAKISGTWMRWNASAGDYTITVGASLPAAELFKPNPAVTTTGLRNYTAMYTMSDAVSRSTSASLNILSTANYTTATIPVTIVDVTTNSAIGGSSLGIQLTANTFGTVTGAPWFNQTSATGKFNLTGHGLNGLTPFTWGDTILMAGNASGYQSNGYSLQVTQYVNGVTQYIGLLPNQYIPIAGEFTAIASAYNDDSTASALSGVSVAVKNAAGNITTKITPASGIVVYTNLTAGNSHTITASKPGYTPLTKFFTGGSASIVYIDLPMSPVGINPTPTTPAVPTTVPTGIPTTGPSGTYEGFWGPLLNLFGAMGASNLTLNLLMTCFFVFCGVVVGGFGNGTIIPGAAFSPSGSFIGGFFGFVLACAFGFISVVYVVVTILMLIFIYMFFVR